MLKVRQLDFYVDLRREISKKDVAQLSIISNRSRQLNLTGVHRVLAWKTLQRKFKESYFNNLCKTFHVLEAPYLKADVPEVCGNRRGLEKQAVIAATVVCCCILD